MPFPFFRRQAKPQIINLKDFGPLIPWPEVCAMLKGQRNGPWFRLLMQMLEFHRQLNQQAVQDKSNASAGTTNFEAGAAAGMADVMAALDAIEKGHGNQFPDIAQWFGQAKPK